MKAIVIYKSKTGLTKKYAKWIQEELRCDLLEEKKATVKTLQGYDVIIFGSYIRVEKIWGIKKLLGQVGKEGQKKVVLFSTGSVDPVRKGTRSRQ